jgi:hypothetical protein
MLDSETAIGTAEALSTTEGTEIQDGCDVMELPGEVFTRISYSGFSGAQCFSGKPAANPDSDSAARVQLLYGSGMAA